MERPLAELREVTLKLEAVDGGAIVNDGRKQLTEPRNVPLSARQLERGTAMRTGRILALDLVEATTAG